MAETIFLFVLTAIALASYLQVSPTTFFSGIRDAQRLGTLEALLVTQTEMPTIIFCWSRYSFVMTSLWVVVFVVFESLRLKWSFGVREPAPQNRTGG